MKNPQTALNTKSEKPKSFDTKTEKPIKKISKTAKPKIPMPPLSHGGYPLPRINFSCLALGKRRFIFDNDLIIYCKLLAFVG